MAAEPDAVGEVATGALIGRALEPRTGETGHDEHGSICLNCNAALAGPYCHECGQPAHVHRSLGGLLHEIAHGAFHFDSKILATLPLLAWRPGELTRRYIAGERARFISPLALFLFSVFLMFAVLSLVGGPIRPQFSPPSVAAARHALAMEKAETTRTIARLQREVVRAKDKASIEAALGKARAQNQRIEIAERAIVRGETPFSITLDTGWRAFDEGLRHAGENPKLLLYKLQSSAYKFSWALIPISLPFIWLLFALRRDVGLYDHAVFATYSLAAMTLFVVLLSLGTALGMPEGMVLAALAVAPPVHMYRQLKQAYGLKRRAALWRTAALLVVAYLAAFLFFLMLLVIGVT